MGGLSFVVVVERGIAVVVEVVVIRKGRGTGGWILGATPVWHSLVVVSSMAGALFAFPAPGSSAKVVV